MADSSLFEAYFNQRKLNNPAFNYERGKGFVPSESTKQIVNKFKEVTGKDLDIRPANSVMVNNEGIPFWGTGGGVAPFDEKNVGYVDPLIGNAHVVAHEGAHALMRSPLFAQSLTIQPQINPLEVPRDTGQRMRYVHETLAKPIMEEEANAQGIAYGVLNKLGMKNEEQGWKTPIDYPRTFLDKGLGTYTKTEIGPPTAAERKELQTIIKSTDPYLQRMFQRGYDLIR
jgi:hypothetical protein